MANDNEIRELEQRLRDPATVRQAFTDAIQRFSEPLYWQIRRMVGNHDDADDLLQNTFMKAWSAIENFRGQEASLSTWLHKIAINESLSFLERRRRTYTESIDTPGGCLCCRPVPFRWRGTCGRLRMAVDTLPPKQKLVFNMKYFDDMKYERISEILQEHRWARSRQATTVPQKIENFFRGE